MSVGKHEYMVIVFNIYRTIKELSGGPSPCLSFNNRDHSWIFCLLCLQGNRLMKIKGLLASAFFCVFFQLCKKSNSCFSWDFLMLASVIWLTFTCDSMFTEVSEFIYNSILVLCVQSKVLKYCRFDFR